MGAKQQLDANTNKKCNINENKSSEEYNNIELVIWCDGKGYTYWQAATVILREANELLRADLEQLGVKINRDNIANKTASNKTIFEFNDTVDSVLPSQSRRSLLENKQENNSKENQVELMITTNAQLKQETGNLGNLKNINIIN